MVTDLSLSPAARFSFHSIYHYFDLLLTLNKSAMLVYIVF